MPLLRLEHGHRLAAARDFPQRFHRIVIRPAHIDRIDETEIISRNGEASAGLQGHVLLDLVALDSAGADGEHPYAEMSDAHSEQRGRQGLFLAPAPQRLEQGGKDDPESEAEAYQSHPVKFL